MRISDWSSDVCSSDLVLDIAALRARQAEPACRDLKPIGIGCGGGESRAVETVDGSGANIHARIAARGGRRRGLGCRDSSGARSEEHTSELQSLMRISYAVFCLKKKKN